MGRHDPSQTPILFVPHDESPEHEARRRRPLRVGRSLHQGRRHQHLYGPVSSSHLVLEAAASFRCSREDLEDCLEAYHVNNRSVTEFDYKHTRELIDYILVGSERRTDVKKETDHASGTKREQNVMSAPSTPLKKQRESTLSEDVYRTPVSGRMYEVSSSPSVRHKQSPK